MKTIRHEVIPYGHCAAVCPFRDGVLLAYYNGPECQDTQALNLEYWVGNSCKASTKFLQKTGNCMLIPMKTDRVCLIFSYFHDSDLDGNTPKSAVQRWMFCTNWKTQVTLSGSDFNFTCFEPFETEDPVGYLTRCAPVRFNNIWYFNCKSCSN